MSRRGPKPGYLQLVDAAETADAGEYGGVITRRGTACRRTAGWGTEHAGRGPCRDHPTGTRSMTCPLPLSKLEEQLWNDVSIRLRELRLFKPAFWPTLYALIIALATLHDAREELDAIAVPGPRRGSEEAPRRDRRESDACPSPGLPPGIWPDAVGAREDRRSARRTPARRRDL